MADPLSKTGKIGEEWGPQLRHLLFDHGLITVTPRYAAEASKRIREQYENGRIYYALHGERIALPDLEAEWPDRAFPEWHNREVVLNIERACGPP